MEQVEHFDGAHGVGNVSDRGRVGEVATHRHVGQQQMLLDHGHQDLDVRRHETELRADGADEFHPHHGVIAGVPLAEVVEQRAEHEQVGSAHAVSELGRVRRGLPEMSIDREAVVGVALRTRTDRSPFGEQTRNEVALIERFQHGDCLVALE